MKKLSSLLVLLVIITSACDDDPNDVTPTDIDVIFSVDLSGDFNSSFSQDSVSAFYHSEQIIIKGFDVERNIVTVLIDPSFFTQTDQYVGDHTIGNSNTPARVVVELAGGAAFFISDSGTLSVTEFENNIIKGTFHFESTRHNDPTSHVSGVNGEFTVVVAGN